MTKAAALRMTKAAAFRRQRGDENRDGGR